MTNRMVALATGALLTAGFVTSCAEKEKKVETVTESTTTEPVVAPAPDTVKMDTAAPMPVKT
ncbi:MAG: hypothetical protein EOO03_14515, partial [Chitinophagaceae bacterium]